MKKIIFILTIAVALLSCEKDNPTPDPTPDPIEDDCNDFCKCGEVTGLWQLDINTIRYTIKNHCTNELTTHDKFPDGTYYGDNMCLDYCW